MKNRFGQCLRCPEAVLRAVQLVNVLIVSWRFSRRFSNWMGGVEWRFVVFWAVFSIAFVPAR